jgi:shikimate 5-dehydrogenase
MPVTVSARSEANARRMIERSDIEARVVTWGTPVPGALILNATPIGMNGELLPEAVLAAAGGLFDMTYGAGPSPGLLEARANGLPTADGIDLLWAQAEESFRIWTGVSPPAHLFERVARNASRSAKASPIQKESE